MTPRVVIIGGGLGGLCLAQGLRGAGISVTVHERDPDPVCRGQGYRLHIGGVGASALAACLPPRLYELVLATGGRRGRQVTVATSRLRTLRTIGGAPVPDGPPADETTVSTAVNRQTLREILLTGLTNPAGLADAAGPDDQAGLADLAGLAELTSLAGPGHARPGPAGRLAGGRSGGADDPAGADDPGSRGLVGPVGGGTVRFGSEFVGYDVLGDRVRARFADGSTESADVLIGADGAGSRVRGVLLPDAAVPEVGIRVIYGRTLLDDDTRPLLPPAVLDGFLAMRSFPRPVGLALGLVEPIERPADAAALRWPGLRLTDCPDYLMWALTAPTRMFPAELSTMDGAMLRDTAGRMVRRWHPNVRELVRRCQVDQTMSVPIRVAQPVPPWPAGPVTLLGDAIHAMSPSGGSGANTALRDAALLTERLTAVARGELDLPAAIGSYQRDMLDYGFAAVRASQTRRIG